MDLRKIKKLIELVEESGIAELEVSSGDESIRIARFGVQAAATGAVAGANAPASGSPPRTAADVASGSAVRAPMAGVFYAAPEPGAEPFVRLGQSIAAGDVICIIESMKMMNEIRAERAGTCCEIAARNGDAVASGDLLFRLI